ncbi:uncharacterized protein METZ01_LOCUS492242, partial [marine metagenome]
MCKPLTASIAIWPRLPAAGFVNVNNLDARKF